jgi:hypothetical protein
MNAVSVVSAGCRPAARTILRAGATRPNAAASARCIAVHPTGAAPPLIVDDSSLSCLPRAGPIDLGGPRRHGAAEAVTVRADARGVIVTSEMELIAAAPVDLCRAPPIAAPNSSRRWAAIRKRILTWDRRK